MSTFQFLLLLTVFAATPALAEPYGPRPYYLVHPTRQMIADVQKANDHTPPHGGTLHNGGKAVEEKKPDAATKQDVAPVKKHHRHWRWTSRHNFGHN